MVNKVCFVISPIGKEGTDIRRRSDLTFNYIIKPIVQDFGYEAIRADHINESGMITNQIIDYIIDSSLVIADLTDSNPNVFYELAIRHIVEKPYIQLMKSDQQIPFDISGMRTIRFDIDLEQADNAKKELSKQIKSIENNNFKPINPVTLAVNYSKAQKRIKESGSLEPADITKVVLESVTELRLMIDNIGKDIYNLKRSLNYPINNIQTNPNVNMSNENISKIMKLRTQLKELTYMYNEGLAKNWTPIEIDSISARMDDIKQELSAIEKLL